MAEVNSSYTADSNGFSSVNGSAPVTITAYTIGQETTLDSIKDYDGSLHAGDNLAATASSYKYQGMLDVNGDGIFEAIFTNKVSKRWVTAKVDSTTGQIDDEALFYLNCRGLDKLKAQQVLLNGFCNEFVENIANENLKLELNKYITSSNSTGRIRPYFNHSVDTSFSTGVNAQNITTYFNDTIKAYMDLAQNTLDICVYKCIYKSRCVYVGLSIEMECHSVR